MAGTMINRQKQITIDFILGSILGGVFYPQDDGVSVKQVLVRSMYFLSSSIGLSNPSYIQILPYKGL